MSEQLKVGTFIQADNRTFYVEDASGGIEDLGKIFTFEETDDGKVVVLTASKGALGTSDDNLNLYLTASGGEQITIAEKTQTASILTFDNLQWKLATFTKEEVSPRGYTSRELTISEIWFAWNNPPPDIEYNRMIVDFHSRVSQIVSVFILPLIAIPLALGASRAGRASGIVIGLIIVFVYYQFMVFGEGIAREGVVSPWISIWGCVATLFVLAVILFPNVAFRIGGDPYSLLGRLMARLRRSESPQEQQDSST